jgi:hypothetical protein
LHDLQSLHPLETKNVVKNGKYLSTLISKYQKKELLKHSLSKLFLALQVFMQTTMFLNVPKQNFKPMEWSVCTIPIAGIFSYN